LRLKGLQFLRDPQVSTQSNVINGVCSLASESVMDDTSLRVTHECDTLIKYISQHVKDIS